jgi:hypothetical protein
MAEGLFELAQTLSKSGTVKPRNRELAILKLASVIKAPYIAFCHRDTASRLGISDGQWHQGLAGQIPEGLSEEERLVYRLGRILLLATEPLSEDIWQDAIGVVSKVEFVGIVHVVGAYRWVSLLDLVHAELAWAGGKLIYLGPVHNPSTYTTALLYTIYATGLAVNDSSSYSNRLGDVLSCSSLIDVIKSA